MMAETPSEYYTHRNLSCPAVSHSCRAARILGGLPPFRYRATHLQLYPLLPQLDCPTGKFYPDRMLGMLLDYPLHETKKVLGDRRTCPLHELWVNWWSKQVFPVPASPTFIW